METSEQTNEIQAALVAFHLEHPDVKKDSQNPHFRNTFASLAANINAADEVAAKHGLCVVQLMDTLSTDDRIYDALTTRICHTSGQWMQATMRLHLPKDDPQGQGSSMTYGRRYNYQGAYGLVAEDDDAEAAVAPARSAPAQSSSSGFSGSYDRSPAAPSGQATTKQINWTRRLLRDNGYLNPSDVIAYVKTLKVDFPANWDGDAGTAPRELVSAIIDDLKDQ